jgi:hypothetical protein
LDIKHKIIKLFLTLQVKSTTVVISSEHLAVLSRHQIRWPGRRVFSGGCITAC